MNNLTLKLLVILLLSFGIRTTFAQNFVPPQALSFPYSQYGNKAPSGTENFGGFLTNSGFGVVPIYMSSIYSDDPVANPGEFIVMITDKIAPTNILYQHSFLYPECTDIQMGVTHDYHTKINYVVVAYHKANVGHLLDIYEVTNSTSTPLVLNSTETLSNIPNHTRINMDSDLWSMRTLIAWEHPTEGIQTMVMYANQPNGITTLAGTQGASNPDVAINNVTSTPQFIDWAHIVYQDKAQNTISVEAIQLGLLATPIGTNATVNAQVVDVRSVPVNVSAPHIDCPNSVTYGWAYTYTDGRKVIVRLREWNTYNTIVVNDGSLGNTAASQNFTAYHPTLFYGNPVAGTGGITVAWYSVYPGSDAHYIALEVTPFGTLLSAPDYLRLPAGIVSYTPYSGIDLGRLSDGGGTNALDYLYATYIVRDQNLGFTLQHAFHKWNNSVFSGTAKLELEKAPTTVFPNPFSNYVTKNITVAEDGLLQANLTDITGRIVAQYNERVQAGNQTIQIKNLGELLPGTYYLSTFINNKRLQTEVIVKR